MKMSRVVTAGALALGLALTPTTAFAGPGSKSADLSIAIGSSPSSVEVGDVVTHTVTVLNAGPNSAGSAVATYDLDPSMTLLSVVASQGSCSGTSRISCSLGTVANGAMATVTVQVRPTAAGSFSTPSTVGAATPDPDTANNTATVITSVNAVERIATTTLPPVLVASPCFSCGFHNYFSVSNVSVSTTVVAEDGVPVNGGTVTFAGCSAPVVNGRAGCSYQRVGGGDSWWASYSGSPTHAPSSYVSG